MSEPIVQDGCTIYFEDCTKGMMRLEDDSIDLIIADPPFGIGFDGKKKGNYNRDSENVVEGYKEVPKHEYQKFCIDWLGHAKRVLKPYGTMYVFSSWNQMYNVMFACRYLGLRQHSHLTWAKTFPPYKRWNWVDGVYHIFMLLKYDAPETGKPKHTFNKVLSYNNKLNLCHYPRSDLYFEETYDKGLKKNATKLPDSLIEHLILTSSNKGDLVLDPFLGNGTTAEAAIQTGRRLIGFEINENCREVIQYVLKRVSEQNRPDSLFQEPKEDG